MDEQINIKDANNIVRKNFRVIMKQHGFLKNKKTGFYFRIQDYFLQVFILRFLRSLPQIECLLFPTFLYVNGNLPYMNARYAHFEERLSPKTSIYFSDIIVPGSPQVYQAEKFNRVWKANQNILEKILIPYLDNLDFYETLSVFQSGRNEYFQTRMGAYDYVSCAVAVGRLKCFAYEESYEQLLNMRDIYARAVSPSSKSTFLFQKNLDYIDDLLFLLQNKPDHWEDKISERIAKTELETSSLWMES